MPLTLLYFSVQLCVFSMFLCSIELLQSTFEINIRIIYIFTKKIMRKIIFFILLFSGITSVFANNPLGNMYQTVSRDSNIAVLNNVVVACSAGNCCEFANSDTIQINSIPTIVFKHELYDDGGNNYDPATGIFTAPLDGIYNCSAVLLVHQLYGSVSPSNDIYLRIDKNDKYLSSSQSYYSGGNTYFGFSINMDIKMAAGENIRFKLTNSSGTGFILLNNDGDTRMSIHLVK